MSNVLFFSFPYVVLHSMLLSISEGQTYQVYLSCHTSGYSHFALGNRDRQGDNYISVHLEIEIKFDSDKNEVQKFPWRPFRCLI